jgi:hypothetical protein
MGCYPLVKRGVSESSNSLAMDVVQLAAPRLITGGQIKQGKLGQTHQRGFSQSKVDM